MSLLKAGLQLAAVTAYRTSLTNPNPSETTTKTNNVKKPRFDDIIIGALLPLGNFAIVLPALAEMLIALALSFPSPYSPHILSLLGYNHKTFTAAPSLLYVAGAVLAVLGSMGRVHCFRVLGKHFTFNIGIVKNHSLVTAGAYSWVRHPSYTFAMVQIVGLALMHTAPDSATAWGLSAGTGSWLREADACRTVRAVVALLWGFSASCILKLAVERPPVEDAFLHREFGKEWEEYARRVKYRTIPGVY